MLARQLEDTFWRLKGDCFQPLANWLSDLDSNQDKGLQRALCYRYTIGQRARKTSFQSRECKGKIKCLTATDNVSTNVAHVPV